MFTMLLPITLPVARSGAPRTEASRLTTSSGNDVAHATTVSPMNRVDRPRRAANRDAPLTSSSAPPMSSARPRIRSPVVKSIGRSAFSRRLAWQPRWRGTKDHP